MTRDEWKTTYSKARKARQNRHAFMIPIGLQYWTMYESDWPGRQIYPSIIRDRRAASRALDELHWCSQYRKEAKARARSGQQFPKSLSIRAAIECIKHAREIRLSKSLFDAIPA